LGDWGGDGKAILADDWDHDGGVAGRRGDNRTADDDGLAIAGEAD